MAGPLQVHDDVRRGVEARLQVDGRLLGRGELALVDAHAAHRVRRAAALAALWAHGLGDRRRCAPVVLLTLPAALVARLPIARVRGGCISCSFRSPPSGCRQALQVGGAARAAVGQAQPHVLLLGRLARLAVELRREPATTLRPGSTC